MRYIVISTYNVCMYVYTYIYIYIYIYMHSTGISTGITWMLEKNFLLHVIQFARGVLLKKLKNFEITLNIFAIL